MVHSQTVVYHTKTRGSAGHRKAKNAREPTVTHEENAIGVVKRAPVPRKCKTGRLDGAKKPANGHTLANSAFDCDDIDAVCELVQ